MRKIASRKPKVAIFSAILLALLIVFTVAKQSNFYGFFEALNQQNNSSVKNDQKQVAKKESDSQSDNSKMPNKQPVASETKNNNSNTGNNSDAKSGDNSEANKQKDEPKKDETGKDDQAKKQSEAESKEAAKQNTSSDYKYKAVAGDSYTLFSRDAIHKYLNSNNLSLSDNQKLQAEVTITNQAGAPELEIGQDVTIPSNTVTSAINQLTPHATNAAPQKASNNQVADKKDNPSPRSGESKDFSVTAKSGDNYALLSREAIKNYAAENKINLDAAQKIAAETYIISEANFPEINVDQSIVISHTKIKNAVDKVIDMSQSEKQNWQPFADQVQF